MIIDFKAHLMNEGSKDYFRLIVMNGLQGIVQFSEEIPKRDIVVELSEENQVINLYYVPLILKAYKDVKKSSKRPYVEAKRNTRRMLRAAFLLIVKMALKYKVSHSIYTMGEVVREGKPIKD